MSATFERELLRMVNHPHLPENIDLIERFGQCNRKGEFIEARIYWMDLDETLNIPHLQSLTIRGQ